jgi:hypothetical protein
LARQLCTSHQLLKHYLDGLDKWRFQGRYRKAKLELDEIRARAKAENRALTPWEEQRAHDCLMASLRAHAALVSLDSIERIKQDARRGPLHPAQLKMLKLFAKQGFPAAQELLPKCLRAGVKQRKRFAEIVKETPRQEGEATMSWVRRIWNQCSKYVTNCPANITEELLQRYSRSSAQSRENNLPPISADSAKSFRTAQGKTEEGWQLR